jgi:hypothetical protein
VIDCDSFGDQIFLDRLSGGPATPAAMIVAVPRDRIYAQSYAALNDA